MADIPDDFFIINTDHYPSNVIPENSALVFTGFVRTSFEIVNDKLVMKIVKEDLKYVRLVRFGKDETKEKSNGKGDKGTNS